MTQEEIHELVGHGRFPDGCTNPSLVETHASWVVLTRDFAFKIKKPVRFSFLDFSTLALRKHYCEEELRLNRRLTDIYQAVVPIVKTNGQFDIGIYGEAMEYAVQMERLPPGQQMNVMLENGQVGHTEVEALGQMIARFHQYAEVIKKPFEAASAKNDFADLANATPVLTARMDEKYGTRIAAWISLASTVIEKYKSRFGERVEEGFVRDGHGDLHAGNIFLLDQPVIFDCIEFNEHFRINDVLSELAFLCMDLDRYGRTDLKETLIRAYRASFPCFIKPADEVIFQYYLLYRASVRLKVAAIKLGEELQDAARAGQVVKKNIQVLGELCERYAERLKALAAV
ncbi:MAG: phosphotransferase [Lewinellaceae bacterium]|nr:phosphotransferase [Saprospiraceae bacterium]MCB9338167.1 phosphotransferase [Lewinellaceae bacterium]